jgi:OOP family OmpA-OmpF porin
MKQLGSRAGFLLVALAAGLFSGCASYEVNTGRGNIPGHWVRAELQEADRAVESARKAGKDRICPAEFKAAEAARDHAYDVFRACHTEEGAALAKQATAKANALCPPQPVKALEPVAAPKPEIAVKLPACDLMITPDSIVKGDTATLTWTSRNATRCEIEPGIGPVQQQGTTTVKPDESTLYTLVCSGAEGSQARSKSHLAVTVKDTCAPMVINITFDVDKWEIRPQFHDELKKLADFLKKYPNVTGVIEGHTDSDGSMHHNMRLSQHRADSVRTYLINQFGISAHRLGAKGFGPTKPVADNKTAAGKQKNRRIEANFTCN